MLVSLQGRTNVVKLLLAAGANKDIADNVSICIVSYIILYYHYVILIYINVDVFCILFYTCDNILSYTIVW